MSSADPKPQSSTAPDSRPSLVDAAWQSGGTCITTKLSQNTVNPEVVVNLELTDSHIFVSLSDASIHVFDLDGNPVRVLQGHTEGVWTMQARGNTLFSGGADDVLRVWNLETG